MRTAFVVLIYLTIAAVWCPSQGVGNMLPLIQLARGGTVSPKSPHHTIRMASEQVIIRLKRNTYTVDAVFHFFNTGETTTEWVGFPRLETDTMTMTESMDRVGSEFVRYDAWVDGTKIPVEENSDFDKTVDGTKVEVKEQRERVVEPGPDGRVASAFDRRQPALGLRSRRPPPPKEPKGRWRVHHITFPGHATTTVSTSYEAYYSDYWDFLQAYYIVGTGGLWKDSIGKAVFVIDSSGLGETKKIRVNFPGGCGQRQLGDSLIILERENLKPGPDDRVTIKVGDSKTR
ncbi:MAG: hypothetical protein HY914_09745 [Desulfomonile tiedjei]|nr:hypothetical protein [Desulfomonile tiedjei]